MSSQQIGVNNLGRLDDLLTLDNRVASVDRRETDRELSMHEVGKREMLGVIAHYVSNPLFAASGIIELLSMMDPENSEYQLMGIRLNRMSRILTGLRNKYVLKPELQDDIEPIIDRRKSLDRRRDLFAMKKDGALELHTRCAKAFKVHLEKLLPEIGILGELGNIEEYAKVEKALVAIYHMCDNPLDPMYLNPSASGNPFLQLSEEIPDENIRFN